MLPISFHQLTEVVEEVKWRTPYNRAGVPMWSHGGIICTGEIGRDKVNQTFAKGAEVDAT